MSSYLSAGANKLRRAREWATPTLKSSAFLERGVLTPEEFVRAGDELVYKCPTWQWESGDKKKAKNYLPSDKQVSVCDGWMTYIGDGLDGDFGNGMNGRG